MEQRKVRILAIAPYEGMRFAMQKLARERNDIELDVYIGELDAGAEIVQKHFHGNYDMIITRGGTADFIESNTALPVIEISLSVYDILRAIRLAGNFSTQYAISGFPSITRSAKLLCDLLHYKAEIFTIHHADEAEDVLLSIKKRGYDVVLCDVIANTTAKKLGLNSILITSGNESIENAFDQAVKLCRNLALLREENIFLKNVIQSDNHETVIFDERTEIFFSTLNQEDSTPVLNELRREIPTVVSMNNHRTIKNIGGVLYSITGCRIPFYTHDYVAFYFTSTEKHLSANKYGIKYLDLSDVENNFLNSFYNTNNVLGNLQTVIEQMAQTSSPIMIIGEYGTGRERVAEAIYAGSPLHNNPMIVIDIDAVNEKGWNFLIRHCDSPFYDNGNTIYLNNINLLSETQHKQFLSLSQDINLPRRNRLIFSFASDPDGAVSKSCMEYVNLLSCLSIHLPPLRTRKDEIPTLANLSISALNISLAKEILGLQPQAMDMLMDYDWPGNYTQFERILNELAVVTTTPYILEDTVSAVLSREATVLTSHTGTGPHLPSLNLNRTLEEINQDIINAVLEEANGNQTQAAKRLGISRTTLWRILKG